MAKYEAHQEQQRRDSAVGRSPVKKQVQGSLRASILSSASGGRPDSRATTNASRAGSMSKPGPRNRVEKKLDMLREIHGNPLSESTFVRQWGSVLVSQLGLNFYPTKPRGFDSSVGRSKRTSMVPPRVARSMEEAFSIVPETDESMYLSRYMLGADRTQDHWTGPSARMLPQGTCDEQTHSPPASTNASTALPVNASVRFR